MHYVPSFSLQVISLLCSPQAEVQLQESEGQVQKLWESLGDLEKSLQKEQEEKASLERTLSDERNKMLRLQTELKTSEEVQRDFVRLSQKLQVMSYGVW
ncbi:hypothetical protein GDO81_018927 [Engystomops pustulosus]|uniref:Rab GTPase-binding effector protein 2 n=1 Tax=Engystomops pustulosus TaxID=76066 RepID=A0AAV6YI40_ENGPU|nr:hypothetical protein GDO81_018927 [Engystomops pustulosus]KAG8534651.1 hypothetical protein GDO81_018927 [Engystomops pustulosus]